MPRWIIPFYYKFARFKFIFLNLTARNFSDVNSILKAVENGDVDGALIDRLTAARLDELSDPSSVLVVKDIIPKPSTYGIFLTGDAVKLHKKFRQYLQNNAGFVTGQIKNYTQPLKVRIRSIDIIAITATTIMITVITIITIIIITIITIIIISN